MTIERLEELKRLVLDGLYTDETGTEEVFEHFYTISTTQQADLLALIDSEIQRHASVDDVDECIIQKLDIEDSYIHQRIYWRTMTKPMKIKEAIENINRFSDREQDLHRIVMKGGTT